MLRCLVLAQYNPSNEADHIFRMSKTASSLITQSVKKSRTLNTFVRQNTPASKYYFTTDKSSHIMDKNPALRFKSGGWQEDNKKWGLLWTLHGSNRPMPKLDMCVKQKLVRVTTNSGQKVMAVTYNTDRLKYRHFYKL